MRLAFTTSGWDDYTHWQQADRQVLKRINRLIDDALSDPTGGIGKPEPLRHMLTADIQTDSNDNGLRVNLSASPGLSDSRM